MILKRWWLRAITAEGGEINGLQQEAEEMWEKYVNSVAKLQTFVKLKRD